MIVQPFPSGSFGTNAYVVACPETRIAVILDPSENSAPSIINFITKNHLKPEKILLTHSHWDHIVDIGPLIDQYSLPVFVHPEDAPNLIKPGSDGLPIWLDIPGIQPTGYLNEGDQITVGDLSFEVIHTPGHSPGGVCFYCPEKEVLFSGDTLFKGTLGNLSFPTSNPTRMWTSLAKLSKLPPQTRVYPGHGDSTTIGAESWLSDAEQIFGH